MAVDVDRLTEVEELFRAPAEGVDDVVGVFGPEAGEDDAAVVRLAVAVGVLEEQQFRAGADVGSAVAGGDAGRDEEAVGEDRGRVGGAVVVLVFDDQDLVVGDLARFDLGVDFAGDDPEPPLRVEVHLDRLGDLRVGGEEVDLEAFREDEGLPFQFRIGEGGCLPRSRWA